MIHCWQVNPPGARTCSCRPAPPGLWGFSGWTVEPDSGLGGRPQAARQAGQRRGTAGRTPRGASCRRGRSPSVGWYRLRFRYKLTPTASSDPQQWRRCSPYPSNEARRFLATVFLNNNFIKPREQWPSDDIYHCFICTSTIYTSTLYVLVLPIPVFYIYWYFYILVFWCHINKLSWIE